MTLTMYRQASFQCWRPVSDVSVHSTRGHAAFSALSLLIDCGKATSCQLDDDTLLIAKQ